MYNNKPVTFLDKSLSSTSLFIKFVAQLIIWIHNKKFFYLSLLVFTAHFTRTDTLNIIL
jgi:hypothetical protein